MKSMWVAILLLALGAWLGCAEEPAAARLEPGVHEQRIEHAGVERTYLVHVPPRRDGARALPLVFLLHGRGGNGRIAYRGYGFAELADAEGFLLVCPDATGRIPAWNSGYNSGRRHGADDVGFIAAVIDRMQRDHAVDPRRIFVAGHSSGAMMSHRLGAELSHRVAAIAPVAGSIGYRFDDGNDVGIAEPGGPVSVIAFHGMADRIVPYDSPDTGFYPVAESIAFWVRHNGCDPTPVPHATTSEGVVHLHYAGGKGGAEVELYSLVDGDHGWPGARARRRRAEAPAPVSATELIWQFFQRHPRPEPTTDSSGH